MSKEKEKVSNSAAEFYNSKETIDLKTGVNYSVDNTSFSVLPNLSPNSSPLTSISF